MKTKFLAALAATAGLALAASQAQATTFSGTWELTAFSSTDPGLVLGYTSINSSFDGIDLSALNPQDIDLFKIFTNEADVSGADLGSADIQLKFTFTEPTGNDGPVFIDGDTNGFSTWTWLGNFQGGHLEWSNGGQAQLQWGFDDPNLVDPGRMTITVNGGDFNVGWFGTDRDCNLFTGRCDAEKKGMIVTANFDWDNDPTFGVSAAPEPGTWALMIMGFGAAGATLRRRRALAA
jgi:hypothetical protein